MQTHHLLFFLNRVAHLYATMFIGALCFISWFLTDSTKTSPYGVTATMEGFFDLMVLGTGLLYGFLTPGFFKYYKEGKSKKNYFIFYIFKLVLVCMLTDLFWSITGLNGRMSSKTQNQIRFFSLIFIYILSSYMKYYKENHIMSMSSEVVV